MSALAHKRGSFQLESDEQISSRTDKFNKIELKQISERNYYHSKDKIMTGTLASTSKNATSANENNNNKQNATVDLNVDGRLEGVNGNQSNGTSAAPAPATADKFPLSKRRWLILFGLCVFGFCNGLVNETSSILNVVVSLLGIKLQNYVYLSQIFTYIPMLISMPAAWLLDKFGLQLTVYLIILMTIIRNVSRFLLYSPELAGWHEHRFWYWLVLGIFQNIVVLVYYLLPLKVSESWFSESERSIAWTMLGVMPTVGTAVVQLIVPRFVHDINTIHPLAYLNIVCMLISIIVLFGCITKSQPSKAPSQRSSQSKQLVKESMLIKIRRLLLNWNLMIHMLTQSTFDTMTSAISSVLQDIFQGAGLDQVFCGQFLASMALLSFVLQMFASSRSNKNDHKMINETVDRKEVKATANRCKLYMVLINCAFLFFAGTLSYHHLTGGGGGGAKTENKLVQLLNQYQWVLVMLGAASYTAMYCISAPAFKEMSATLISGSISEATQSAASTVIWCVLVNVFSVIFVRLRRVEVSSQSIELQAMLDDDDDDNHHHHHQTPRPDYSRSVLFMCVVSVLVTCLYLATFDGKRKKSKRKSSQLESGANATGN